jgi:4a-hydroxytetrahydrobiopterin dehydratase
MKFVNNVAEIAETEDHHPDILIHNWNKVQLTVSTHTINGLSDNDFLAAKIEKMIDKVS